MTAVKTVTARQGVKFGKNVGFRKELNRRVEAMFAIENLKPRDNPAMYLKTVIILGWVISAWAFTVFGPSVYWMKVLGCVTLGFAISGVGFSIGHDANHGGYSNSHRVNRIIGSIYDVIGVSSYLWRFRHNVLHHTYTNILDHDVEIHGKGLVRMTPSIEHKWIHQFQHIFIWFVYPLVPFLWSVADVDLILFKHKYQDQVIPQPKALELIALVGFKLIWLGLFVGIPIAVGYSPIEAIIGFTIAYMTYGLWICTVFMVAHVLEPAEFIESDLETVEIDDEWAIFQVKTAVDFAPNNWFLNWYLGGLNYQVVHHLYPHYCHIHYPKIAPILAELCEEYGVKYNVYDSFWETIVANYRWLKKMGTAPSTATTV